MKNKLSKTLGYWRKRHNDEIDSILTLDGLQKHYEMAEEEIVRLLYDLEEKFSKLGITRIQRSDIYKYNRLELLMNKIQDELKKLGKEERLLVKEHARASIKSGYNFYTDNVTQLNKETIKSLVATKWSSKHFSERIYTDKAELLHTLENAISLGITLGKRVPEVVQEVKDKLRINKQRAETLVRTETVAYFNLGARKRYEDSGVKKIIWISAHDEKVCPVCTQLDGAIYDNPRDAPPVAHPNCRCTIIPFTELVYKEFKKSRGIKE